jgi:hypothetical protein
MSNERLRRVDRLVRLASREAIALGALLPRDSEVMLAAERLACTLRALADVLDVGPAVRAVRAEVERRRSERAAKALVSRGTPEMATMSDDDVRDLVKKSRGPLPPPASPDADHVWQSFLRASPRLASMSDGDIQAWVDKARAGKSFVSGDVMHAALQTRANTMEAVLAVVDAEMASHGGDDWTDGLVRSVLAGLRAKIDAVNADMELPPMRPWPTVAQVAKTWLNADVDFVPPREEGYGNQQAARRVWCACAVMALFR